MQPLTMEDRYLSKRTRMQEWGKNAAVLLSLIVACVSIAIAIVALNKANEVASNNKQNKFSAKREDQQTTPLQDVCFEFKSKCNVGNQNDSNDVIVDLTKNYEERLAVLETMIMQMIQNKTDSLRQSLQSVSSNLDSLQTMYSNITDNSCNCSEFVATAHTSNVSSITPDGMLSELIDLTSSLNQSVSRLQQFPWPYNGYVYSLTNQPYNWEGARQNCRSFGAELAVNGVKDYAMRLSIASAMNLREVWVGISDQHEEGNWTWIDGTIGTTSDIMWTDNQPDNSGGREHCGEIWPHDTHNYRMNDEPCSALNTGLCERPYVL